MFILIYEFAVTHLKFGISQGFVSLFHTCYLPHAGTVSGTGNTENKTDKSSHSYEVYILMKERENEQDTG